MVAILNIELDTDGRVCLENYRAVRDRFVVELDMLNPRHGYINYDYLPQNMDAVSLEKRTKWISLSPHSPEVILAEVLLRFYY